MIGELDESSIHVVYFFVDPKIFHRMVGSECHNYQSVKGPTSDPTTCPSATTTSPSLQLNLKIWQNLGLVFPRCVRHRLSCLHFRCPWLSERFSVAVPIYNGVIFLFVLANFCMATFMDPGIFPRGECMDGRMYCILSPNTLLNTVCSMFVYKAVSLLIQSIKSLFIHTHKKIPCSFNSILIIIISKSQMSNKQIHGVLGRRGVEAEDNNSEFDLVWL